MGWKEDWIKNHYDLDDEGNFENESEFERALKNGDLTSCNFGRYYYDRETGQEYWPDGTKKG